MLARKNVINLLNKAFFIISKNGFRACFYESSSAIHCRHVGDYKKKNPPLTNVADKKKASKLMGVLAELDVLDDRRKQIAEDPVKKLSKMMSHSEKFIKIIKCERNLDRNAVINILENYTCAKNKFLRTKKYREEISSSIEFEKFLKALEENLETLEVHDLGSALSCIHWFNVSRDHDLYISITLRIIDKLNEIKLEDAVLLLTIVNIVDRDAEDDLKSELSEELKLQIEKSVKNKIDNLNETELKFVLKYLRFKNGSDWPDKVLITLLDSCFNKSEFWTFKSSWGLTYYVNSFLKDDYKKKENQLKIVLQLFDYMLKGDEDYPGGLCFFAREYAFLVRSGQEPFDEKLFNSVLDYIMKKKLTLKYMYNLITATNLSRYIRTDVLILVKKLLTMDSARNNLYNYFPSKNEYFTYYRNCINILACSEFQFSSSEWYMIKTKLYNHHILTDVNEWKDVSQIKRLRLALSLASLEIFPKEVLKYLSQISSFSEEEDDDNNINNKNYLLLALNQAVTLLNVNDPTYYEKPGSFLDEKVVSACMTKAYEGDKHIPEKLKTLIKDIGEILQSLKIPFSSNLFTKLGHDINFMVAVNSEKKFFHMPQSNEKRSYAEDVSVPSTFKKIVILPFSDEDYCRNWLTLGSHARVKVKTLEAMKYSTSCILYDRWTNLSTEGKKKVLMNEFERCT